MARDGEMRIERDSMGEMSVPAAAYYGAQTQRAVENFPISGIRFPRPFISALGIIKSAAAKVNLQLGLLDGERARWIMAAADEVEKGLLDEQFVLDIFQTGSGTSTNMNANEVIAKRAAELSQGQVQFHPNDHVNMGQSSNDVIPTAIHIAAAQEIQARLLPALEVLRGALAKKAGEFSEIVKTGRTHLQDATPITLGQEFSGYESQIQHGIERLERVFRTSLAELALGGTAVGTGVNTHPEFAPRAIEVIRERTGVPFVEARNHFEAQAAKDAIVELSGVLKTVACSLGKIANDIRWLGSGPRCGLGELALPEVQPGSSIMPGKVNPVIAESALMAVCQIVGNDAAITAAGYTGGIFELHVLMPVLAHNVLQSIALLSSSAANFSERCVAGVRPNRKRIQELAEASITVVTALAPKIGYDLAAKLAKEAFETGESLRTVALRHRVLPPEELDHILDLMGMTRPGIDV